MPITVRCPNDSCARSLKVPDAAAGKTGKCPACGTRIAIPASDPEPDQFAVLEPVAPAAPAWSPEPVASNVTPSPAAVAPGVFRFEAFGEAWRSFKQQAGVWIAAALIFGFATAGIQIVLNLLAIPISIVGGAILPRGIAFLTSLGSAAVSMAVSGIFMGGMYAMALKQVDGHRIGVKDMFPRTETLPSLALASVLASLATLVGFLCLVIPGWIIWGLFLFSLPLVVDRRLKAIDAMGTSWTTLKGQWLQATVFVLVLCTLQFAGMLVCLLGSLVAFPLCVLSQAILYRGFFASGRAFAKKPVQSMDPDFGPVGAVSGRRPTGRIPGWAWLVAVIGLLAPVVATGAAIALMVAIAVSASRGLQQNAGNPQAFQDAFREVEKRGGNPGAAENKFAEEMRKMIEQQKKAGVDLGEELRKAAQAQKKAEERFAEASRSPAGAERQPPAAKRAESPKRKSLKNAGAANPPNVTALLGELTSDDAGIRRGALDRLARSSPDQSHHDEVIKALEPFLVEPQAAMRVSAVKALAAWANSDDVPALIAALDDEDRTVRRAAILAFGRLKDERAVEPVARQLADPDASVQNDAVRVLRQIGSIAETEVIKYLESSDIRTREQACQVLQTIGTKESVRALTSAAAGKTPVSRHAQAALKAITARERRK